MHRESKCTVYKQEARNRGDMSVADLTPEQVEELAKYLDQFPASPPQRDAFGNEVSPDQYWRQLVEALGGLPRPQGRAKYSVEEVEGFAMEELENRSPSRRLLLDLKRRRKPPSLEAFVSCLDGIKCRGAQNVFINGSELQHRYLSGSVVVDSLPTQ